MVRVKEKIRKLGFSATVFLGEGFEAYNEGT